MKRDDEGTILLMTIGLVILMLLVVAAVVDVSAVYLARRDIVGSCDATALASVQTADTSKLYGDSGASGDRLPLDAAAARTAAEQAAKDQGGIAIAVTARDTSVEVTCSRPVRLPLNAGIGPVTVTAVSDADTPLR